MIQMRLDVTEKPGPPLPPENAEKEFIKQNTAH